MSRLMMGRSYSLFYSFLLLISSKLKDYAGRYLMWNKQIWIVARAEETGVSVAICSLTVFDGPLIRGPKVSEFGPERLGGGAGH